MSMRNGQGGAASIAATGFGLTALCIGEQRGFISTEEALERVFATLRFLWKKLPNHRGFFYHFANPETGERMFDSEVSSVDTAILLVRGSYLPRTLPPSCGRRTRESHLQPRGLDLALGRHLVADARLDAGNRISSVALGLLQRADDDVPAGHGIVGPSAEAGDVECVEAS